MTILTYSSHQIEANQDERGHTLQRFKPSCQWRFFKRRAQLLYQRITKIEAHFLSKSMYAHSWYDQDESGSPFCFDNNTINFISVKAFFIRRIVRLNYMVWVFQIKTNIYFKMIVLQIAVIRRKANLRRLEDTLFNGQNLNVNEDLLKGVPNCCVRE